jgi:hypothetical protein
MDASRIGASLESGTTTIWMPDNSRALPCDWSFREGVGPVVSEIPQPSGSSGFFLLMPRIPTTKGVVSFLPECVGVPRKIQQSEPAPGRADIHRDVQAHRHVPRRRGGPLPSPPAMQVRLHLSSPPFLADHPNRGAGAMTMTILAASKTRAQMPQ